MSKLDINQRDFQGLTLDDLKNPDKFLKSEVGDEPHGYEFWSTFIKLWYAWGKESHLKPVGNFLEQTRLYVEVQTEVSAKILSEQLTRIESTKGSKADLGNIDEMTEAYTRELPLSMNEALHERGVIAPFQHFRITVDPETFEPEEFNPESPKMQQRILAYANGLYRIPKNSSLTWRDFSLYFMLRAVIDDNVVEDFAGDNLVIGTSKLVAHQNFFIASRRLEQREQLRIRRNGRSEVMEAYSKLALPRGIKRPDATELLTTMQKTLLRHKEEAASLLKTHLYLTDCAYKKGGNNPIFSVHMDDLLEAKGYIRRSNGAFQTSTYREEWGRIATLAGCWLEVNRVTETNKKGKTEVLIDETPYWEVRARRRREGDHIGFEAVLLEDPNAPVVRQVVIQPGMWWAISDRGAMNFRLPYEVLALPTDGRGNEVNRMAVQLAATLALWIRSSQRRCTGASILYNVGALLEASGVKTEAEFLQEDSKTAKRLRTYLAGELEKPGGVLKRLSDINAFDIVVNEEGRFWSSGRGWQHNFWNAKLQVEVPDLEIGNQEVAGKK